MLIDTLRPGGAERMAATVAARLDPARFERFVCVTRTHDSSPLEDMLSATGVQLVFLERDSRHALRAWGPLIRLLRDERIDVLHAHMFGSNLWGVLVARLAGVPVVVAHEHSRWLTGGPARKLVDRTVIAPLADVFLTVSEQDRRSMIAAGGIDPDRVRYIPNGIVPLPPAATSVRNELGIPDRAPVIGTLTVLRRVKALEVLVEATALLRREFADLRTLIAGAGPEYEHLRAAIHRFQLDGIVSLLGPRTDIAALLEAFDVGVLSSDSEGSPLAIMEYAAAGKPAVATRVGGIPELIEHGVHGLLVPPRNPEALADAIASLLRDPGLRAELGANARERQQRDFDIERTVRRLEDLYEQLILARARGGDVRALGRG